LGQEISLPVSRIPLTLPIDTAVSAPRKVSPEITQLLPEIVSPVALPVVAPTLPLPEGKGMNAMGAAAVPLWLSVSVLALVLAKYTVSPG
jgi:hypothetical protein